MMRKYNLLLIFAVALIILGIFIYIDSLAQKKPQKVSITPTTAYAPPPVGTKLLLTEMNGSKTNGYFRIREIDGKVVININFVTQSADIKQSNDLPAALYNGTCSAPGTVKYYLKNVNDGGSETILPVAPSEFVPAFPLALIVRTPTQDAAPIVCGDISSVATFK